MEKLESYELYRELIKKSKLAYKNIFTNMDFLKTDLESYIKAGKMYYEKNQAGVLFFLDEGKYYKLYMCVNGQIEFKIMPENKKILIRNMYKKGQNISARSEVDKRLVESGFIKKGLLMQAKVETKAVVERHNQIEKYMRFMETKGYRCVTANMDMVTEIEEMLVDNTIVEDYDLSHTFEEMQDEIKRGAYLCILDKENQICAASIAFVKNNIAKGMAVAVREQFRMNGFAPVLLYERCKILHERNIQYLQGWVLNDNIASLKYHKKMGYKFTDKYADEWLLGKKED